MSSLKFGDRARNEIAQTFGWFEVFETEESNILWNDKGAQMVAFMKI